MTHQHFALIRILKSGASVKLYGPVRDAQLCLNHYGLDGCAVVETTPKGYSEPVWVWMRREKSWRHILTGELTPPYTLTHDTTSALHPHLSAA